MKRYVYHNQGPKACFQKGVEYLPDDGPFRGETLVASNFRTLNGNDFKPGDDMICGYCGNVIECPCIEDVGE
jgi:hypothetical protein